jgi:hypothetical protein
MKTILTMWLMLLISQTAAQFAGAQQYRDISADFFSARSRREAAERTRNQGTFGTTCLRPRGRSLGTSYGKESAANSGPAAR